MDTVPVPAMKRVVTMPSPAVVLALTVNVLPAGVDPVSRASSKVTSSVSPLTDALRNPGAMVSCVLLVTVSLAKVATSVPLLPASSSPAVGLV